MYLSKNLHPKGGPQDASEEADSVQAVAWDVLRCSTQFYMAIYAAAVVTIHLLRNM